MAHFSKQIDNPSQIDTLFAQYFETGMLGFNISENDNPYGDFELKAITKRTNTEIIGTFTNGMQAIVKGTGFLSNNPIITSMEATLGHEVFTVNGSFRALSYSGSFTDFTYQNNQIGVSFQAQGNYDLYNIKIDSFSFSSNDGLSISLTGQLSMGKYQDDFSGVINSLTVSYGGKTDKLTGLNLDYYDFAQTETYSASLSMALSGHDTVSGTSNNDILDGSTGSDTLILPINLEEINIVRKAKYGGVVVESSQGVDKLLNIESIHTLDGSTISLQALMDQVTPSYQVLSNSQTTITPDQYTGPVTYLEFSMLGDQSNEVILGSNRNDFMNLLGGDDAADGGAGDDVLDGGTGSNFLTGGGDNDTFFLDGRGGETTWSTITDFSNDEVNIWGWQDGVSNVLLKQVDGAEGFKGATLHLDLDGDNEIDTSVTLTGIQLDAMPESSALSVAGNGYLLIA